ncbi:MAG: cell envelope integrity protein TolA [Hyphomonadaceae bacterium]|nr:cell envelope integrity protein TolA [Hyphomonadaceae bacterium]
MRAGWVVSLIGHVGFVIMTMLAWETRSTITAATGSIVPIEIVDVAAESNVRALAEDVPDEEVAAAEETPSEAEPEPAPSPTPQPQRPRQNSDEFDLSAVAGLLDKQREPGRERQEGQRADRTQRGAGLGTAEVAAMEDRVRSLVQRHLMRCWRMPIDQADPERLVVTLEFELDRNGNLRGPPRVTSPRNYTFDAPMRVAVESAQRAVTTCDPFPFPTDPVVGEHYETWDRLEFTFRPRS